MVGGGTRQSKLKLTRSIEQMHLAMIVNKHATKYSMQVPSLSEVVERGFWREETPLLCLVGNPHLPLLPTRK